MYQTWVQRVSSNFKFNPKSMNRIFKDFDSKQLDQNHHVIDYNKLVNEFFKNNDTTYSHEDHDPEPHNFYPLLSKPIKEDRYRELATGRHRELERRNDFELPLEEIEIPEEPQRRTSARLNRQISEIGFNRRESANEFFNPESNDKPSLFRLDLFWSVSKNDV